ncbi:hypothetical protein C8A00DRAFT_40876 [Chaetomidium leptoderma]|uniref:IPT/TIG domain-containing protein n=1 Tax=Chaetomidium leptoderma TaxID=669021 RepID=A0AAN6VUW8_9PEZI|nr:hypothetical protein C8A00DRAFT_40876 [Chaetomidium leptoderma]
MADQAQFESDFDMSHFINEFIIDSDEGSPLPDLHYSDDASPHPHRPQSSAADSFHAMPDAPQGCGSPSEALGLVSSSSRSMDGLRGSAFGSASSKRTSTTALTQLTTGDLRMDAGANGKTNWDMVAEPFGEAAASVFPMAADGPFGYLNGTAATQSCLQSPMDSPSPFGSALTTLSPEAIMASPPACDDGYLFTFNPSGMQSDAMTPGSLCLRPSQPAALPKYEFRGSQDTGAGSTPSMPGMLDAMYPNASQFAAGRPFFPNNTHIPAQLPVERPRYGPAPYTLEVGATNTKSRVETQITIKLRLSHLPLGVTKVHLPKHTISKPKFWSKPPPQPSPDMLEMHAMLVCTSAMQVPQHRATALKRAVQVAGLRKKQGSADTEGEQEQLKTQEGGEVQICENCIGRERKRAGRKKSKHPQDEEAWRQDEARRVIVFNTQEVKEWALQNHPESGARRFWQVEAPMRIACYCRHHAEKQGFQLIFTLTDHLGQLVAQTMSESIMITDDHKTTSPNPAPKPAPGVPAAMLSPREDLLIQSVPGPSLESSPSLDLQAARRSSSSSMPISAVPAEQLQPALAAQHLSRPASPSFPTGPAKRRRGNHSTTKIPSDLAMTPLDTSFMSASRMPSSAAGTAMPTPATSAFSPTPPPAFLQPAELQLFGPGSATPETSTNPFGNNLQTGGNNSQLLLPNMSRTSTLANLPTSMFGPTPSARQAPPAGRTAARPAPNAAGGQGGTQHTQAQGSIYKVIPGEGPVAGGIEVTLMGVGFDPGMKVFFGDKQAPGTMFWSPQSIVCMLPPSEIAGMVPITVKGLNVAPQWFRYVDDSEQQLLRTALMILGNKMTGGYEDPTEFARRIIKESSSCYPSPSGDMSGLEGSSSRGMANFEGHLLKLMELMDLSNSTRKPRLNLRRRTTGQTMLHLACKMGLHRFVAGLLARGANPDPRDNGGYTALHMASLSDHIEIVRLLISHRADPTLRTLSGLTATDVAQSKEVVRIIQRFEQRRSQSDSSSHSRVNSVASLKSLRAHAPLSQAVADSSSDEPGPEEGSSEEYSEAYSSDIPEESGGGEPTELRMRRGKSGANTPARVRSPSRARRRGTDATGALMAAIREQVASQFQQLHQRMEPHLQYLPQLPQFPQFSQLPTFPQMPNMPPLPEYQNAVLQRLATMIGGARPVPGDDEPSKRAPESAWQYLSPFSTKTATPPPAYDELFPHQGGLDTKRSSAAQAAADAVADAKCAALFDQAQTSASASAGATTVENVGTSLEDKGEESEGQEIPALLQIGRKDAITREQQATLRRAHAQNLKKLSWDRNLFFIWIPLLILMVGAMMYNGMPGFVAATRNPASVVPKAQQVELLAAVADVHQVAGIPEALVAAVV